jgi:C-terminal processing protease CtpA/Prc
MHAGLGVRLRHSTQGYLSVAGVMPGGAAHNSGLVETGDFVLAVDGIETTGKTLQVCGIFIYI